MSSHPETQSSGKSLLCLAPLLFALLSSCGNTLGASLREHRPRGSESDPPHQSLDEDMVKALRHIENLHHRTGTASRLQTPPLNPEYDAGLLDDTQKLRAMLTLAHSEQSQSQPGEEESEHRPNEEEEEWEDNKGDQTQEWFQAVLRALEQTGSADRPHHTSRHAAAKNGGFQVDERAAVEAKEGGEGEEEEEEEDEGRERGSPLVRRTGEDVGEKYTPQKLATLQSIFEEVGRLANSGRDTGVQRGEEEEDEEVRDDEDNEEALNVRSLAHEDLARGLTNWAPLQRDEEEEGEEEEQRGNKLKGDQSLDYSDIGEEEGNDDGEEEENEGRDEENFPVKRSTNSDMANLMDYYLLKVLEKTEEEKRELDEEEEEEKERAERRVSAFQYRDNKTPQDMYQLIRLSQKYQIPPEDLLAMLRAGDTTGLRSQAQSYKSSGLTRAQNRFPQLPSYKNQKSLGSKFYSQRIPDRQSSSKPKDVTREEILNILGLGSMGKQASSAPMRPKPYKSIQSRFQSQPRRQEKYTLSQMRVPNKLKDNYDDTVGEDELAMYLAGQILGRYPAPIYNKKAGQKQSASESISRDEDERAALGSFEQAVQDYFERMEPDDRTHEKRQSEAEDMGGAAQTQMLDDQLALMKIMTFLNPEGETSNEKDTDQMQG